MTSLAKQSIQQYQEDGYLIIESFLNETELDILARNAKKHVTEFQPKDIKIFTTDKQNDVLDTYFIDSAEKITCFFEENAFDDQGNLIKPMDLAINKVGHAMHDLDKDCEKISYSQKMLDILQSIGIDQPVLVQSQYIFKQPKIGAEVHAHTDSTFIYTKPLSCVAIWVALEDATIENGCLCIIPKSHHAYPLQQQYCKSADGNATEFHDTNEQRAEWDLSKLEPLEVKKGDMVLMHGEVVHASYANKSQKSRHAFVLHAVDQNASWVKENWLQRSEVLPFRSMATVVKELQS